MTSLQTTLGLPRPTQFKEAAYGLAKRCAERGAAWLRLTDRHAFRDRSQGRATLVVMLIGYKPDLWPWVMPAFEAALPPDADVCLLSPGKDDPALDRLAEQRGWSYLATATNDVSLAQNVCLTLHPAAALVVKVDEDMFLLEDTLTGTIDFFRATQAAGVIDPGYASPMIPINGVCYRPLLTALGALHDYEARFGRARLSTSGIPVQTDPDAACWIWSATGPIRDTLARLRAAQLEPILAPIQFSIGAIVYERRFWSDIGYFPVHRHQLAMGRSTLGADERHLCKAAVEWFKPGIVCPTTLAGHFSFGPQYAAVRRLLDEQPALFAV